MPVDLPDKHILFYGGTLYGYFQPDRQKHAARGATWKAFETYGRKNHLFTITGRNDIIIKNGDISGMPII